MVIKEVEAPVLKARILWRNIMTMTMMRVMVRRVEVKVQGAIRAPATASEERSHACASVCAAV